MKPVHALTGFIGLLGLVLGAGTPPFSAPHEAFAAETTGAPTQPRSASGPVLPGEADLLWQTAQEQIQKNQLDQAILTLTRLANRIPTHDRAIQSQRLLGELELERGNPASALEWFRIASNNLKGKGPSARELDLLRARAYLMLGKSSEALLLANQLLEEAQAGRIPWAVDAQIVKTRALLQLGQRKRVTSSLIAARKLDLSRSLEPRTAALWMEVADLQAQEAECARFPSALRLTEEQVIDQAERKASCVQNARKQHEKIALLPHPSTVDSRQALVDAESSIARIRRHMDTLCDHPPLPLEKRSKPELEAYLAELKLALQPACTKAKSP